MKQKRKSTEDVQGEPKLKKLKATLSETKTSDHKNTLATNKIGKKKLEKPLSGKVNKLNTKNALKPSSTHNKKKKQTNNIHVTEKTNWVELKKVKKELKEKRKARKLIDVYDICIEVKRLSEKLRRSDCKAQEKKVLIEKAHKLLQTHYSRLIFTHDISRIIQWILKFCDENIRQDIINELKPSLVGIVESKYAKNCLKTILKQGSQQIKNDIISAIYGNIVRLMSHNVSAPIVELIYTTYTTNAEKLYFKQEFYGDMYKGAKDKSIENLASVFKSAKDMKTATLSAVKGNLLRILNKKLVNSTLVQTVLWEFLVHCSQEDRNELIVMLRDSVVELSKTTFGTKIAIICIWYGTNKDKKIIIKSLKENIKTIAMSKDGYMILLALFDSVDDTVLVKKIILPEIQKDLTEIALNEFGRHVILYLVARRDRHYFPPSLIRYLNQGDNSETCKKPADLREKELLQAVIDTFLQSVTTETALWLSNGPISMVTLAILKAGYGENLKLAFESVAAFLVDKNSKITDNEKKYHPVEHPSLHMILKKIIQNDKKLAKTGETSFGIILIKHLTTEVLEKWIQINRGCFLIILLIENEPEEVKDKLISKLKPLAKNLEGKTNPGASILLKKLE